VHVTVLADDGPGSLRAALSGPAGPRVVLFDLDGSIDLLTPLLVAPNVTIDGRGHRVTLRKKGLVLGGSDEVIVTNVAIADVGPDSEDGIQIGSPVDPAEHVVIDHVTFQQSGSGGDSKNGDAPAALDEQMRITVHHSYAHATGRRHPQARHGVFDFYDNEWNDWRMYGWIWESPYREAFGAQAQDGARILFESNIAVRAVHPYDQLSQANDVTRCESGGIIDERSTWIPSDSTAPLVKGVGCPAVTTSLVRPYAATIEPADAKLRAKLEKDTGNVLF
jgi:pectate lyase